MDVPNDLDSFYTWIHKSDGGCADIVKYRFSNSKYPIFKENGFFQEDFPDSSYRLTISHVKDHRCKSDTIDSYIDDLPFFPESWPPEHDTLIVDGLKYRMIKIKQAHSKQKFSSDVLLVSRIFDGYQINISCECAAKNCDGFIEKMKNSLKTIQITKLK